MNDKIYPYLMPKPECANHLNDLDNYIKNSNYHIKKIYKISNWEDIAREIYKKQLNNSSKQFVQGFESHVFILKYFFSNRSLILTIDSNEKKLLDEKMNDVFEIKQNFRKERKGCYEDDLIMLMDLSKIKDLNFSGNEGVLGTYNGDFSPLEKEKYSGSWDYVFFKYVHCPEPEKKLLENEWNILKEKGIISNSNIVSDYDWKNMKYQKTMVPFSECKNEK